MKFKDDDNTEVKVELSYSINVNRYEAEIMHEVSKYMRKEIEKFKRELSKKLAEHDFYRAD